LDPSSNGLAAKRSSIFDRVAIGVPVAASKEKSFAHLEAGRQA
jgi:hypothetical protein